MVKRVERGQPHQPAQPVAGKRMDKQHGAMVATSDKVAQVASRGLLPPLHSVQKKPPRTAQAVIADTRQVSQEFFSTAVTGKTRKRG